MQTILIKRKQINNTVKFEVLRGPSYLIGLEISYPVLKVFFDRGHDVEVYEAGVLVGMNWN